MKYQSLLAAAGLALVLPHATAEEWIHYFPAADNTQQQGFARITNTSNTDTVVTVTGTDDAGVTSASTVMFSLAAGETLHFNSQDLENGNPGKGLNGTLDNGTGSWRLQFSAASDIVAMGLFRNDSGFVNNIHDTAATNDNRQHKVPFFNPASNTNKVSRLRLINTSNETNTFQILAWDDDGEFGDGSVYIDVAPNASAEVSAVDLEQGSNSTDGTIGDGAGKWRFRIISSADSKVMSLLEDPEGNLSNLSLAVAPEADGSYALNYILPADASEQSFLRITNPNDTDTTVNISGIDDDGNTSSGNISVDLAAGTSINFRSEFLENGNANIGLQGALGNGTGFWRLLVTADRDIDLMGLFRTNAGFLNTLHDNASLTAGTSHTVSFFNPGSNANQVSVLRVNNLTDAANAFSISGIDDNGNTIGTAVALNVDPRASAEISAAELESAGMGNGTGKWRLDVTSTGTSSVQSLLRAPDDFQSNLSTWVDISDKASGVFLDSPVAGLTYAASPSGLSGVTTGAGTYFYEPGDTMTFSIGALAFPAVTAGPVATPFSLSGNADSDDGTAINITLLLQGYDADANPENGIEIIEGAEAAAAQVDFGLEPVTFINSAAVVNQLAAVGRSIPADPNAAVAHLEDEMQEANIPFIQSGYNTAVGAWQSATFALLMLPDEELRIIRYPGNGTDGLESGSWVQYGSNDLEFRVSINDDGLAGFCPRAIGSACVRSQFAYDITGAGDINDQLVLFNTFTLDRNLTPGSSYKGVWRVAGENAIASLAFLEDGTFLGVQSVDDNDSVGFEKGTYTVTGNVLNIDVTINNDGDALLCRENEATCSVAIPFVLDNDNITFEVDGESFGGTRRL